MKQRIYVLVVILFVSVICTACDGDSIVAYPTGIVCPPGTTFDITTDGKPVCRK